jgi:hypothetical protein
MFLGHRTEVKVLGIAVGESGEGGEDEEVTGFLLFATQLYGAKLMHLLIGEWPALGRLTAGYGDSLIGVTVDIAVFVSLDDIAVETLMVVLKRDVRACAIGLEPFVILQDVLWSKVFEGLYAAIGKEGVIDNLTGLACAMLYMLC